MGSLRARLKMVIVRGFYLLSTKSSENIVLLIIDMPTFLPRELMQYSFDDYEMRTIQAMPGHSIVRSPQ